MVALRRAVPALASFLMLASISSATLESASDAASPAWPACQQWRAGQTTERPRLTSGRQTQRIYENMALLAFDLLARIIAMRIDARPPFSALYTLWLSMMAAVGLASRSSCSRHGDRSSDSPACNDKTHAA
jgi:hypothetical protein